MKKIVNLIISLAAIFTLSSCMTAFGDDMYDEPSISVILSNGSPYYYGGIRYYVYDGYYYRPYFHGNRYYMHRYAKPPFRPNKDLSPRHNVRPNRTNGFHPSRNGSFRPNRGMPHHPSNNGGNARRGSFGNRH